MGGSSGSFCAYYKRVFRECGRELWATWRTEAWPSVLLALGIYVLTRRSDLNALKTFVYTAEAAGLYLGGWGIYHLIRTPWKLSLRPIEPMTSSLKEQTLNLSTSILEFIYERATMAPTISTTTRLIGSGSTPEWIQSMEKYDNEHRTLTSYQKDTLGLYQCRYERAVTANIASLKELALDTSTLGEYVSDLVNEADPEYTGLSILIDEWIK